MDALRNTSLKLQLPWTYIIEIYCRRMNLLNIINFWGYVIGQTNLILLHGKYNWFDVFFTFKY